MRRRKNRAKPGHRRSRLGIAAGVVLAGVLLGGVGVSLFLDRLVTKEWLVGQIQQAVHGRVGLDGVEFSLFRPSSRLRLTGLEFSQNPEDGRVDAGHVKIEEAQLSVSLWDLLRRRLEISEIKVRGAHILCTVYEDGGNSLEDVFVSPKKFRRRREMEKQLRTLHGKNWKRFLAEKTEGERGGFNAFDNAGFVAALGRFSLTDSSAEVLLEKSGLRIRASGVSLGIGSLEIDPKHLAETDSVALDLSGMVRLDSKKGWHYADFDLSGHADAVLFNPQTGDMEPDLKARIVLGDDSFLSTRIPVLTGAWNKLARIKWVGKHVKTLPEKATFGRSQSVAVRYHRAKITVLEPLSIWVADWEAAVLKGSWVKTSTNQHVISGELLASEKVSAWIAKSVGKLLKRLPGIGGEQSAAVAGKMLRDGRLVLDVKSTGDLSNPKIHVSDPVTPFVKALGKQSVKGMGGKLLDRWLGDGER